MKVLVTGASGFIGKSLCKELVNQNKLTVATVRTNEVGLAGVESMLVRDINEITDWSIALKNVTEIVHLAARVHVMDDKSINPLTEFRKVNVEGTLNLAKQASAAGVKRFIFISSIGVNGKETNINARFYSADEPNPRNIYSISKQEAELGLHMLSAQTGMELVIIRPPLVYGFAAPGNFARLMIALQKKLPLPLGAIHNKRSFVFVGNLVDLIIKCIDHPAAANQVFLVSDGQDLSTTELLQGCAEALGVKSRLLPIPQKFVEACAILLGKRALAERLCGNLQVDITKTRELLGWTPPFSVADGLRATAHSITKLNHK
ncbi:MAG: SDR family oxidoreductase [Pedobacter sp.]|nr:SDR family oxidoreductase [Pedobacter sp.]